MGPYVTPFAGKVMVAVGAELSMVKVRVRIDAVQYLDYLSYHCINGAWLITAKSFHIERRYEAAANG